MSIREKVQSKAENARFHVEWAKFLEDQRFTYTLTLQWNRSINYDKAFRDLKTLHARIDRKLLGTRFAKSSRRSKAIFFLEGEEGLTLHAHSQWLVATGNEDAFEALFPENPSANGLWKTIAPSGSQKLILNSNATAAACYITKQNHLWSDDRRIVFSDDFLSASARHFIQ